MFDRLIPNSLISKKKKRILVKPAKERALKAVSAKRFNDMISYYTTELKSRLLEIKRLKEENDMLIKTSIKNASRSDERRLTIEQLNATIRELECNSKSK